MHSAINQTVAKIIEDGGRVDEIRPDGRRYMIELTDRDGRRLVRPASPGSADLEAAATAQRRQDDQRRVDRLDAQRGASSRAAMIARNREAASKPLAATKGADNRIVIAKGTNAPTASSDSPAATARERMIARNRDMGTKPLSPKDEK